MTQDGVLSGPAARRARQERLLEQEESRLHRVAQAAAARREREREREKDNDLVIDDHERLQRVAQAAAARREKERERDQRDGEDSEVVIEDSDRLKRLAQALAARREKRPRSVPVEREISCEISVFEPSLANDSQDTLQGFGRPCGEGKTAEELRLERLAQKVAARRFENTLRKEQADQARLERVAHKAAKRRSVKESTKCASQDNADEAQEAEHAKGERNGRKESSTSASKSPAKRATKRKLPKPSTKREGKRRASWESGSAEESDAGESDSDSLGSSSPSPFTPPSPRTIAIAKALATGAPYLAQALSTGAALPQAGASPVGFCPPPPSDVALIGGLPAGPTLPSQSPYYQEVQKFLGSGMFDTYAELRLRELRHDFQRQVLDMGPIPTTGNPSSVLIARIRDAERGRLDNALSLNQTRDPTSLMLPRF